MGSSADDFRLPLATSLGHRATNQAIDLLATGGSAGERPLGRRPTMDELLVVQMTLHGLRAAMAAPVDPLPLESARAALQRLFEAFRGGDVAGPSTPPGGE